MEIVASLCQPQQLKHEDEVIQYGIAVSAMSLRNYPFKCQPHKMVKHTKTICRQQSTKCLSVFDLFYGVGT